MKRNTLDLDFNDKIKINDVINKVGYCRFLVKFVLTRSPSMNGFHVEFWCSRNCDLCRLVFDDQVRFMLDQERSVAEQNVLFDKKLYKKMGHHILLGCV